MNVVAPPFCLIVDDEDGIRQFVASVLTRFNLNVDAVPGVSEMVGVLERNSPDLIFLDISLDGSDAIDGMRQLAKAGYTGALQLISGRAAAIVEDVRCIGERLRLRMLPVLMKPFRISDIQDVLRSQGLLVSDGGNDRARCSTIAPESISFLYRAQMEPQSQKLVCWNGDAHVMFPGTDVPASICVLDGSPTLRLHETVGFLAGRWERDAATLACIGTPVTVTLRTTLASMASASVALLARDYGPNHVQSGQIAFEFSEDDLVRQPDLAAEVATQLRLHGFRVVAGEAASRYLALIGHRSIPVSEVRLESKMVVGCNLERNRSRTEKFIEIIHRAGSVVLADGIDEPADAKFLGSVGCDRCQGPATMALSAMALRTAQLSRTPAKPRPFQFPDLRSSLDLRV